MNREQDVYEKWKENEPSQHGLEPSVEQKQVDREDRTDKFLLLVSNKNTEALKLFSNARVYSCFLQKGKSVIYSFQANHGGYLYIVEGGPVLLDGHLIPSTGAAKISNEKRISLAASQDAELLLVETAF